MDGTTRHPVTGAYLLARSEPDPAATMFDLPVVEERSPDPTTILRRLRDRYGHARWAFLYDAPTCTWTALGPHGITIARRNPTALHAAVEAAVHRAAATTGSNRRQNRQ